MIYIGSFRGAEHFKFESREQARNSSMVEFKQANLIV